MGGCKWAKNPFWACNDNNDILNYIGHITEPSKCCWTNALVIIYRQLYLNALRKNSSVPLNSKVFKDFLYFTRSLSVLISSGNAFHNLGAVYSKVLRPYLVLAPYVSSIKNHLVCNYNACGSTPDSLNIGLLWICI